MVFRYHAGLLVWKYRWKVQFLFFFHGSPQDFTRSSFTKKKQPSRTVPASPTLMKLGGLFFIKRAHSFGLVSFFTAFLPSRVGTTCVLLFHTHRHRGVFHSSKLLRHYQNYDDVIRLDFVSHRSSYMLPNSVWNWVNTLFELQSLPLCRIRVQNELLHFWYDSKLTNVRQIRPSFVSAAFVTTMRMDIAQITFRKRK